MGSGELSSPPHVCTACNIEIAISSVLETIFFDIKFNANNLPILFGGYQNKKSPLHIASFHVETNACQTVLLHFFNNFLNVVNKYFC